MFFRHAVHENLLADIAGELQPTVLVDEGLLPSVVSDIARRPASARRGSASEAIQLNQVVHTNGKGTKPTHLTRRDAGVLVDEPVGVTDHPGLNAELNLTDVPVRQDFELSARAVTRRQVTFETETHAPLGLAEVEAKGDSSGRGIHAETCHGLASQALEVDADVDAGVEAVFERFDVRGDGGDLLELGEQGDVRGDAVERRLDRLDPALEGIVCPLQVGLRFFKGLDALLEFRRRHRSVARDLLALAFDLVEPKLEETELLPKFVDALRSVPRLLSRLLSLAFGPGGNRLGVGVGVTHPAVVGGGGNFEPAREGELEKDENDVEHLFSRLPAGPALGFLKRNVDARY